MNAMLAPHTNDEFDYSELFDPGDGKPTFQDYGTQRTGSLYAPDSQKWLNRDCPLCCEPFSVIRRGSGWYCTHCNREIF